MGRVRTARARWFWLCVVVVAVIGCGDDERTREVVLPAPDAPVPERLSAFGLYPDAPERTVVATNATSYEPRWPLWSNGSSKERVLVMPDGTSAEEIEGADVPPGSIYFKTFSYGDRAIETRLVRRTDVGWEYSVYGWNEDGSDAVLLDITSPTPVEVSADGESFEHVIPSNRQCRTCHEAAPAPVLGYNALQLGDDHLPVDEASLTGQVMGYVVGNCVHCHNGSGSETSSFDLRPDVFVESTVDVPTQGSASGIGIRVVPGEPEESVLRIALAGGMGEIRAMPPIGVQRVDEGAVELFDAWIEELGAEDAR